MSHHCTYPDRAVALRGIIEENVALARDTYRVRVRAGAIAARILPGQFVMLRLPGTNDPLLGRPLAVYDTVADGGGLAAAIDIVYLTVGRMTRRLAAFPPGMSLEVWGPLGNGFPTFPAEHLVMVAGGIGHTPFLAFAKEHLGLASYGDPPRTCPRARKVTLCYGARSHDWLSGLDHFERLGVDVRVSTDDGSFGHHGLVTDLIGPAIGSSPAGCRLVCCGPEAMMKGVARIAAERDVPCHVSLETPMACGIGICFSCVTRVRDPQGGWDYRRTCVEGPVFDARDVVFE